MLIPERNIYSTISHYKDEGSSLKMEQEDR